MKRIGAQLPAFLHMPKSITDKGDEAIALAQVAGLELDEWQCHVLRTAMGYDSDGLFSAPEMCTIVPRQNGKGSILEARELAGLFLLGERLILHSAHEFKTAQEAYLRLKGLIEKTPMLMKQVKGFYNSAADTAIVLKNGQRLRFVARTGGSGRGFSGDCVILDEAYELPQEVLAALLPTLSARPNPQIWYVSSTGKLESDVLFRMRKRGMDQDPTVGYFEWSADEGCDSGDIEQWYKANPALGIRISEADVRREYQVMADEQFCRERLGLWASNDVDAVIPSWMWEACTDEKSEPGGEFSLGIEVRADKTAGEVWLAGTRPGDGLYHIEYLHDGEGTSGISWIPEYVSMFCKKNPVKCVALDGGGVAAELIKPLENLGVPVFTLGSRQVGIGAGQFETAVREHKLRHLDDPALAQAVANGKKRLFNNQEPNGLWAWGWRSPDTDICSLKASTHALHGLISGPVVKKHDGRGWF